MVKALHIPICDLIIKPSTFVAGRQVLEASREEQPGGEAVEGGEAREGESTLHARAVPREGAKKPRVSNSLTD